MPAAGGAGTTDGCQRCGWWQLGGCQGQDDGAWGRRGGRGVAGFLVKLARRACAGRRNMVGPRHRPAHRADSTLLLFWPDHRTAARVGNAREGGSPEAEA